jgi:hypothetical protein
MSTQRWGYRTITTDTGEGWQVFERGTLAHIWLFSLDDEAEAELMARLLNRAEDEKAGREAETIALQQRTISEAIKGSEAREKVIEQLRAKVRDLERTVEAMKRQKAQEYEGMPWEGRQ